MIIAITQARTTSTRLPNKVLKQVEGKSLLQIHVERILQSKKINQLIVATTVNATDQAIVDLCQQIVCNVSRGSENDVLDRFYQALESQNPDYIVRRARFAETGRPGCSGPKYACAGP